MKQLPDESYPANPLDGMLALLGRGVLGAVLFVVLSIVLLPLVLIFGIYMLIMRWRLTRAMRQMSEQMEQGFADMSDHTTDETADQQSPRTGRKHVDVKVTTVEPSDDADQSPR
jgi:ABC-type transport system involved in cytochrome bd biosynthesis fused ATPase/permease subunit